MKPIVALMLAAIATASPGAAAAAGKVVMTKADWTGCSEPSAAQSFLTTDPFARIWFTVNGANAGESPSVQWYLPNGTLHSVALWNPLSSDGNWCFGTTLSIAGNTPSWSPGTWRARVVWGSSELASVGFQVTAPGSAPSDASPQVQRLNRSYYPPGNFDVFLYGSGFQAGAVVDVDYIPENRRLATGLYARVDDNSQMAVNLTLPDPGEFRLTVRNPNGRSSQPMVFYVANGGYKLPYPGGETWPHKQGNKDTPTHSGRLAYAYDFSARGCIVAMKAGLATPHDRGLGNTGSGYGNYVTIDHGNGEFSHYAHLTSGSFAFTQPQWVQQGQALAAVGDSGNADGVHAHVHVTRSSAIDSQSVPFAFDADYDSVLEGPPPGTPVNPPYPSYFSNNYSSLGACGTSNAPRSASLDGGVSGGAWWTGTFSIPQGARGLKVTLSWQGAADLDLYLWSPGNRYYAWNGDDSGYSGYYANPEFFNIANPQSGTWTVRVQGWWVLQGTQPFRVEVTWN